MWSDCGFEVLLVKLGIKTSTLEGLTSAGINFGYQIAILFIDDTWQKNVIALVDRANFTGKGSDWREVGKVVGSVIAAVIEF